MKISRFGIYGMFHEQEIRKMKNTSKRILSGVLAMMVLAGSVVTVSAHSGKTDSSGGHRDNGNISGLGYYHYHCGGYPAHLHTDGVCPYKNSSPDSRREGITGTVTETEVQICGSGESDKLPRSIRYYPLQTATKSAIIIRHTKNIVYPIY